MSPDLITNRSRSILPWRKNNGFEDYQKSVGRLVNDFFNDVSMLPGLESSSIDAFSPKLDVEDSEDKIMISAELPGLEDKDVEVLVEGDYLTIKGEKKDEKEKKSRGRYFSERSYGYFERTMRLPIEVDKDNVNAKFSKGVLEVTLPKSMDAKKNCKKVPIKH
jgi:HSP20 family protein